MKNNPLFPSNFVTMKGNFYYAEHPFDYCLLKNGEKRVIKVAELEFLFESIKFVAKKAAPNIPGESPNSYLKTFGDDSGTKGFLPQFFFQVFI